MAYNTPSLRLSGAQGVGAAATTLGCARRPRPAERLAGSQDEVPPCRRAGRGRHLQMRWLLQRTAAPVLPLMVPPAGQQNSSGSVAMPSDFSRHTWQLVHSGSCHTHTHAGGQVNVAVACVRACCCCCCPVLPATAARPSARPRRPWPPPSSRCC